MTLTDQQALSYAIDEITEIASGFGLDFYQMRYEICPADILYTFGAYGMPTRFTHWSFGKQFHKMKLQYDIGLSKIYELVINSNPCYAFLLNTNSLIQNKLIIAHVLAHCDFFKNNIYFSKTRKDMVESMAATAERIVDYEVRYGKKCVETFLDAVLAIQEHVDPSMMRDIIPSPSIVRPPRRSAYEDLWDLDQRTIPGQQAIEMHQKNPKEPEKDILLFILENSRNLTEWQADILTMLREEMLYFWPQLETKIMNEGWASYWHQTILRQMDLTPSETIEFAKLNASVLQPSKTSINPYYLGVKMYEDIEKRYDILAKEASGRGEEAMTGREKIFEAREIENDTSFIRNYLTDDLIKQEDLYVFQKQEDQYKVSDKQTDAVRNQLIGQRVNGGFPYIVVDDGDYMRNGELYLIHRYEDTELDLLYLEHVLPHIHQLWGRIVHIETVLENKPLVFSYDGHKVFRRSK
ncbi:stage V sporulation protein R [Sporosarcina sp. P19]|uniref:Stage V sporulation protein R n=1 Tax=Sporosarcina ureae TaxID=1571 RepID=A0ABM6JYZ2_SPOUR|nr:MULTISPECIES: SpoVR family protein [Sporosarcina]ARF15415.1 stage V sporulation protein R [Sporosarcina ureae]PIC78341.1 stage V sporulation protein R [Sporosarcina sp. P19]